MILMENSEQHITDSALMVIQQRSIKCVQPYDFSYRITRFCLQDFNKLCNKICVSNSLYFFKRSMALKEYGFLRVFYTSYLVQVQNLFY